MRLTFPHPLMLLLGCVLLAALLTHLLPAGKYERRLDPASGSNLVVAGTYHAVEPAPFTPMQTLLAIPRGIAAAIQVIATVFLVGAAFVVIDRSGALRTALAWLAHVIGKRRTLAIPICCLVFASFGALENMQEEIIALTPALVLLTTRLGLDRLIAVAISAGAAAVGAAFSPVNPFQVGIAQQAAELPMFSGAGLRSALLVLALAIWIFGTLRYARGLTGAGAAAESPATISDEPSRLAGWRTALILGLVPLTFAVYIYGLMHWSWGFDELSALFLAVGLFAGLVGGLGVSGTADAFAQGFREMALAALLIGFARAIFVVLDQGHVLDTVVNGLATPLSQLPAALAALGMMLVQALLHVPVPSVSGQAVLTLPVMAPLADLVGFSRQTAVLAFQSGAGLCELITPTNGAMMAVLAAAGVRYDRWLRFVLPIWLALMALATLALLLAVAIRY